MSLLTRLFNVAFGCACWCTFSFISMDIIIRMTDKDTGEILYDKHKILACQFHRNDTAFKLFHSVMESAVRGIRGNRCKSLSVQFDLCEGRDSLNLPFVDGQSF